MKHAAPGLAIVLTLSMTTQLYAVECDCQINKGECKASVTKQGNVVTARGPICGLVSFYIGSEPDTITITDGQNSKRNDVTGQFDPNSVSCMQCAVRGEEKQKKQSQPAEDDGASNRILDQIIQQAQRKAVSDQHLAGLIASYSQQHATQWQQRNARAAAQNKANAQAQANRQARLDQQRAAQRQALARRNQGGGDSGWSQDDTNSLLNGLAAGLGVAVGMGAFNGGNSGGSSSGSTYRPAPTYSGGGAPACTGPYACTTK